MNLRESADPRLGRKVARANGGTRVKRPGSGGSARRFGREGI